MLCGRQEMENAWNEYLKLESDVERLKQALQEQHRRAFFFQVTQPPVGTGGPFSGASHPTDTPLTAVPDSPSGRC